MVSMIRRMDSFASILNKLAIFLTVCATIAMSIIVFVRVILRYGFNSGIPWAEEISMVLMMWIAFFGGSILFYNKENIAVTVFKEKFPKKLSLFLDGLFIIATMAFMYLLIRYGIDFAKLGLLMKYGATGLPRFWSYVSIPLGASFIFYYSFLELIKLLTFHDDKLGG